MARISNLTLPRRALYLTASVLCMLVGVAIPYPSSSAENPKVIQIIELKHKGPVVDVQYSPDGKYIATASWDHTAKIWDAETGKLLHDLQHQYWVEHVLWLPDGKRLLTATGNVQPQLRIYNLEAQPITFAPVYLGWAPRAIACSADGKVLFTGGSTRAGVSAWSSETQKQLWGVVVPPTKPDDEPIIGWSPFAIAARRNWVAFYLNKEIQVREIASGKIVRTIPLPADDYVKVAFTPQENHLIFTNRAFLYFYRLPSFQPDPREMLHPSRIRALALSRQGDLVATATVGPDSSIRVFRLKNDSYFLEKTIKVPGDLRTPTGPDDGVKWIEFSPDGQKILSIDSVRYGAKEFARVWDLQTGLQILGPYESRDLGYKTAFSPNGNCFVLTYVGNRACVYKLRN